MFLLKLKAVKIEIAAFQHRWGDVVNNERQFTVWDTVKTYLSPKRTPDEKSKRTPVKSQNVLPTKSKRTIDEVKTYPYC